MKKTTLNIHPYEGNKSIHTNFPWYHIFAILFFIQLCICVTFCVVVHVAIVVGVVLEFNLASATPLLWLRPPDES